MKNKAPKMKGLKTPAFLVFSHGYINGLMHTAAIDEQNGYVNAAFVHGRIHKYGEYCKKRIAFLEKETSEARSEAEQLLIELQGLPYPPAVPDAPKVPARKFPATVEEAQACRAEAAAAAKSAQAIAAQHVKREETLARRSWIIRRLVKIREQLDICDRICIDELTATAHALQDKLCVFTHGAILKPVKPEYIPVVEFDSFVVDYLASSEALRQKISDVLDKEV